MIRKSFSFIIISLLLTLFACSDDDGKMTDKGYLQLNVVTNRSVITKGDDAKEFNGLVTIKSVEEGWFKEYDYPTAEKIELKAGNYEIIATSGNQNNGKAGFDVPYYMGKTTVAIIAGETNQAEVECTLTTVKISVVYGDDVKSTFVEGFKTEVENESGKLTFSQSETQSGYFTPGELSVRFIYMSGGEWITVNMDNITEAKEREHYTLKFSVGQSGENPEGLEGAGSVSVEIGETNNENVEININLPYNYTLPANAWAKFAYLRGDSEPKKELTEVYFEWRKKGDIEWSQLYNTKARLEGGYEAVLEDLEPDTNYEYRIGNGNVVEFTTQDIPFIPNMSFDDWNFSLWGGKKTLWYPNLDAADSYWASGNSGVITLGECNTTGEPTDRPGATGKYAKLKSVNMLFVGLTAGNLFTGAFGITSPMIESAKFGRDYTGRPTKLKGLFKYSPNVIDKVHKDYPEYNIFKGQNDKCEIYIRLYVGDNMYTANKIPTEEIAYGTFSIDENVSDWSEFEIPIVYKDLETVPTKIAIVATSSMYGAFFTGAVGSELYLDDFELIYDYYPTIEGE